MNNQVKQKTGKNLHNQGCRSRILRRNSQIVQDLLLFVAKNCIIFWQKKKKAKKKNKQTKNKKKKEQTKVNMEFIHIWIQRELPTVGLAFE